MNADPYLYWRIALDSGPNQHPPKEPQAGFWAMDGNGLPVAIWWGGSEQLECLVDGEDSHAEQAWRFCARYPVSEEQYQRRLDTGDWPKGWSMTKAPSLNPPPAKDDYSARLRADLDRDPIEKPVKPDKIDQPRINTPDLDAFDALRHELEAEIETAEELLRTPVKDQETADRVGVWAKKLSEIEARAEQRRVADKEPFLVGGREVDARWKPVTVQASTFAQRLKAHTQPWLLSVKAAERAKAQEAAAQAEAKWAEVQTIDDEGERARVVAEAQAAEEAAVVKRATAGRTGMKVGLRSEKRARIVDYAKCLAAVAEHAEIREVVEKLAQRSVKGGNPLPGVEIVTVEKVV